MGQGMGVFNAEEKQAVLVAGMQCCSARLKSTKKLLWRHASAVELDHVRLQEHAFTKGRGRMQFCGTKDYPAAKCTSVYICNYSIFVLDLLYVCTYPETCMGARYCRPKPLVVLTEISTSLPVSEDA